MESDGNGVFTPPPTTNHSKEQPPPLPTSPLPDDDDECLMDTLNTSSLPLTEENKSKTGFKDGIKPPGPAPKRKDQVSDE